MRVGYVYSLHANERYFFLNIVITFSLIGCQLLGNKKKIDFVYDCSMRFNDFCIKIRLHLLSINELIIFTQ